MGKSNLATISINANKDNYTKGRKYKIQMITIHHMAGVMSVFDCGKLWQNKNRKASSHYGIGNDGKIASYVDENDTAWTNSNFESNSKSVTIEVSNSKSGGNWPIGDKAMSSLIKLVADIAKRNKLGTLVKGKNLTWHSMYSNTACPGTYLLGKMDYIIKEANKINTTSNKKYTKSEKFLPSRGYYKQGDVSDKIAKVAKFMRRVFPKYTSAKVLNNPNVYGENLVNSIKEFQKRCKLTADGLIGIKTYNKLKEYGFNG